MTPQSSPSLSERLAGWLIDQRLVLALANLLLMAVVATGVTRLSVESGNRVFFSATDPNLLAELQIEDTYGKSDNILIALRAKNGDIFTNDNLAALEAITASAWQMPHSMRVDSITNFQHPSVDGDDIQVANLVEGAGSYSPEQLTHIKQIALGETALVGRLVAADGGASAINVTLRLPENGYANAVAEAVAFARKLKRDLEKSQPQLDIYLSGIAITEQTLADVTESDFKTLIPLLVVLVLILLGVLTRSATASACTLIVILLSILIGMGGAGWLGIGINSVNVSAPTIIMTLAIADCVHIFSTFLTKLRNVGDKRKAALHSLTETLYPVFLTSLTTAIGFLSMTFSESPPFQELGIISAIGVFGAFWLSVSVLPALMLVFPAQKGTTSDMVLPWKQLAGFVVRQQQLITVITLIAVSVAAFSISRLELNDDPADYFADEVDLSRAMYFIEHHLSGTQQLKYSLSANTPGGALDPIFLRQVDRFATWLKSQPQVVNVDVFSDMMKRLSQVMHGDQIDWYRLPESQEMAAQYSLLYEMSVPYGLDPANRVTADKSSILLQITTKNLKSQGLIQFEQKARDWLQANTPEIATRGASQSLSFAYIGQRNIESMLYGSIFALLLVCAILMLAFRSLRYGLVAIIPNLFPALLTLGLWGLLVGEVNMAAAVVFSLTFGIIVDDTTHFLVKYIKARRELGFDPAEAIEYTYRSIGQALLTTSVALAAGFFLLVESDFMVNSTSGLLVAITISFALLLDLLFLPVVLLKLDRWLEQPRTESAQ